MKKTTALLLLLFRLTAAHSQTQQPDQDTTLRSRVLDSILITAYLQQAAIQHLPPVQNTYLNKGKKTEQINLALTPASLADKTGRQVFARVPGIFVYDMDGSGNQINISARGLDAHRGWEFNIRKDGIITNSDMYGYPASHYSMPLESIAYKQLVRGTGSLQYGSQFGGMLNYISKQADSSRGFSLESINTVGSFNLLSSYNAIGGKLGKFRYYAYAYKKSRSGYRRNEHTDSEAQSVALTYEPSRKLSVKLEWDRSAYTYRMPGQLNDSMFHADPQQATRSRNYFNPDIHIPSITLKWQVTGSTEILATSSAVLGRRNSVMFDKATNVRDTINAVTGAYNNRQVDIDRFHSYTNELRILQQYYTGKKAHTLTAGIQYMNNRLNRTQLGVGTTGADFDLSLVTPGWGRDLWLKTTNTAFFAENNFEILPGLSVNTGVRMEMGKSNMTGNITYYPDNELPLSIAHRFPLLGAGFQYKLQSGIEIYGGWSQAYRAMAFKDLVPGSIYEKVDPDIKDAKGYNVEVGTRGNWKFLKWDVTAYLLQYNNRFGTLAATDANGDFYTYRTNIGNSRTRGLEIFLQAEWQTGAHAALSVFTSTAVVDARYKKAIVKSGNGNINIDGNKVESTPNLITRNGLIWRYRRVSISGLFSYTASSFADALNTMQPNTTGSVGLVPSYGLLDCSLSFYVSKYIDLKVNMNNLTNKQYFTKRPLFYPGPGIWPSEGRGLNASIGIKL